jgi:bzd-type benzoyl-CoA reductase N subunit
VSSGSVESALLDPFVEVAGSIMNPAIRDCKDRGGQVVGYFCSMVPEELFMAAGLLPFRMRATGSTGSEAGDAWLTSLNCSFPRHCLSLALEGGFDFLDGVVCINSCDHVRRLYDVWQRAVPTGFIEFLTFPRQSGPDQVAWYTEELWLLKGKLEEHLGVEITADAVRQAIQLANETRGLQRDLYQLRKRERPPITGAEVLTVMVAGTAMPKRQYNELLRALLEHLGASEGDGSHRARLLVTGGILDDPAWVRTIEAVGGLVVADVTCFGARLMWEDVEEKASDPLEALAQYYLADRPSCPRLFGSQERRSQFAIQMFREFGCDGMVGEKMVFCDQWNVEHYLLGKDLKEAGIPFLSLERSYVTEGTGQLKTRVQAFIETMGK